MSVYESIKHGSSDFTIGIYNTSCNEGFYLFDHIHREFEFLVMTKGDGIMYIDGQKFILNEGDGVFINSRDIHTGKKCTENFSDFYAVVFAPEIFGSLNNDLIIKQYVLPLMNKKISFPVQYSRKIPWQKEVLDILDEIHTVYAEKADGYELYIKSKLFNIWYLCFAHSEKYTSIDAISGIEEIKSVVEYINNNYALPLTLNNMAEKANMSREHFCRSFSKIIHMTPFEYLLNIRIENACRMLREEKLCVGVISQKCGFNSFSYFSMKFKELIGCTPTKYAKISHKIN